MTTRELWARQSLFLSTKWRKLTENEFEYIHAVGRELMRRTDTSPERRAREAYQQAVRRAKKNHGNAIRVE